jgi:methyl coenzyme M reductase beta subunit
MKIDKNTQMLLLLAVLGAGGYYLYSRNKSSSAWNPFAGGSAVASVTKNTGAPRTQAEVNLSNSLNDFYG